MSERARRVKGAKFLWLNPEWIGELDAIRDIIKKALASAGKGKQGGISEKACYNIDSTVLNVRIINGVGVSRSQSPPAAGLVQYGV